MLKRTKEAAYCFEKAAEIQQAENAMMAIDSLKKGFECHFKHSTTTASNTLYITLILTLLVR